MKIAGRKYHIQMTMSFIKNLVKNDWTNVKKFVSIKNQKRALMALNQMSRQGYEIMPCSCKKTAKNGECLGFV